MDKNQQPASPYASPDADLSPPVLAARKSLSLILRSFLNHEIPAREFYQQFDEYLEDRDPVIRLIAESLESILYVIDFAVPSMTKQQWDYCQRLLLATETDCSLQLQSTTHWSRRQPLAAAACLAIGSGIFLFGWGLYLLLLLPLCGLLSSWLTQKFPTHTTHPFQDILFPFATLADLQAAYQASSFRKTRFRPEDHVRTSARPHHSAVQHLLLGPFRVLFFLLPFLFSPLSLLSLMWPDTTTALSVRR